MFRNKEIRVRIVKIDDSTPEPIDPITELNKLTKDDIVPIAKDVLKWSALAVGFVCAVSAATHVTSEIIIHHATKH